MPPGVLCRVCETLSMIDRIPFCVCGSTCPLFVTQRPFSPSLSHEQEIGKIKSNVNDFDILMRSRRCRKAFREWLTKSSGEKEMDFFEAVGQ